MRLDKFLADVGIGSRKEVKKLIKSGKIKVNNQSIKSDKFQVREWTDEVIYENERLVYQKDFYYVLNKPAGVVSATQDNHQQTVLDLFDEKVFRRDLFPVGRLDKDTEGLLVITNDGKLAHQLLSPKNHVEKEYFAKVKGIMTQEDVLAFSKGIMIDGEEKTRPAQLLVESVDLVNDVSIVRLILHEGKFHQVKRMVKAVGKEVSYLKRVRMGNFLLPKDLTLGSYRQMTEKEVLQLKSPHM
ncbi:pseudouridine synthase [Enterococcus ratti]|uniref:Pseudouridine synthase n=1 Tax=Enterococcus ratti TaxID=150033 RepID=A0A1L8WQG3_9ENTE|nr:pseudouridine synthase [Enterococcus ratti]OJG83260.1 pseudouridine synthase [Enterococcus ratti]